MEIGAEMSISVCVRLNKRDTMRTEGKMCLKGGKYLFGGYADLAKFTFVEIEQTTTLVKQPRSFLPEMGGFYIWFGKYFI